MIESTDVTAIVEAIMEVDTTLRLLSLTIIVMFFAHALMTRK